MKRWIGTLMLAMTLVGAGPALAKKKGKGKDDGIQMTGVEAFDDVFRDVRSIDRRLSNASDVLSNAKGELTTALGLKKGTPLKKAIGELNERADGKVGLAMKGKVPTLEATDAVPTDVQTGIDAVNQMNSDIITSIEDLVQVGKDLDSIMKKSKKFPNQIQKEFEGEGLFDKIFKMPKAAKTTMHNLGVTKELPGKTERVLSRMQDIEQTVRKEFVPVDKGKGGGVGRGGDDGGIGWNPGGPGGDEGGPVPGVGGGNRGGKGGKPRMGKPGDDDGGNGGGKKKPKMGKPKMEKPGSD